MQDDDQKMGRPISIEKETPVFQLNKEHEIFRSTYVNPWVRSMLRFDKSRSYSWEKYRFSNDSGKGDKENTG